MAASPVLDESVRFAELAVALGKVSDAQVKQVLGDQVRRRVLRVLLAPQVEMAFQQDAGAMTTFIEYVGRFPMSIEALLLEALRGLDEPSKRQTIDRIFDTALILNSSLQETRTRFGLTLTEATFLEPLVVAGATPRALLAAPNPGGVDGLAVLSALGLAQGIRERTPADSSRNLTSPQRATVPEGFRPTGPLPAGTARPMSVVPASSRPSLLVTAPPSSSRMATASTASTAPSSSRVPLTRPITHSSMPAQRPSHVTVQPQRVTPSPSPPSVGAQGEAKINGERAFLAGLEHVKNARWVQASPELTRAAQLMPSSEKVRLCLRWATIHARSDQPASKAERAELARLATTALKEDPDLAFAFYVAGSLALLDDDVLGAHKLLTRAAKDTALLDANRLLRIVERRMKTEPEAKGLLKKKLW